METWKSRENVKRGLPRFFFFFWEGRLLWATQLTGLNKRTVYLFLEFNLKQNRSNNREQFEKAFVKMERESDLRKSTFIIFCVILIEFLKYIGITTSVTMSDQESYFSSRFRNLWLILLSHKAPKKDIHRHRKRRRGGMWPEIEV